MAVVKVPILTPPEEVPPHLAEFFTPEHREACLRTIRDAYRKARGAEKREIREALERLDPAFLEEERKRISVAGESGEVTVILDTPRS
jgi:hypothetical protein